MSAPTLTSPPHGASESRIAEVGAALSQALQSVLDALPDGRGGPQVQARALGLDKVLMSRLLKALRSSDPLAVAHHAPGPEPLRRFLRAARRRGVDAERMAAAEAAVAAFELLIVHEVGDRSALDALISGWLPESREVFELRRRQSAYKALSQLKGMSAALNLGTVIVHPNADGATLDVVWLVGLLGLQRLRAGVPVKLSSRRMPGETSDRRPLTLDGQPVEGLDGVRQDAFCDLPPAPVEVHRFDETVQYRLAGDAFGRGSAVDLILAEVNLAEMARFAAEGSQRKRYYFAEVGTPCRALLFDVLIHHDLHSAAPPSLAVYDTVLEGVASVNDPRRDIDRLAVTGGFQALGSGTAGLRTPKLPRYAALVAHVFERVGWDASAFHAFRYRSRYPLYGSQVVAVFPAPGSGSP
jgi:hypothetical protein